MTAKFSASADGTKVNIGNAAEDALQIDSTAKTIKALAPYQMAGNGPAFRATQAVQQQVNVNVADLCAFNTEEFDTNNCYDTAQSTFTPNVAGYYQINAAAGNFVTGSQFGIYLSLRKNGTVYSEGGKVSSGTNSFAAATVSDVIYFNGTTDYVNVLVTGAAASGTMNVKGQYFSAALVKQA
jgi:hypothetical protein